MILRNQTGLILLLNSGFISVFLVTSFVAGIVYLRTATIPENVFKIFGKNKFQTPFCKL